MSAKRQNLALGVGRKANKVSETADGVSLLQLLFDSCDGGWFLRRKLDLCHSRGRSPRLPFAWHRLRRPEHSAFLLRDVVWS